MALLVKLPASWEGGEAEEKAGAYGDKGGAGRRGLRGHTTAWSKMTKTERGSFQHSYSRHYKELGLPNWRATQAESLRAMFNEKITSIKNMGVNNFFQSREWVNGVKTTVNRAEPMINGQKYYYYETLDGNFVSCGKMP